jgi:hypothetical protein
MPGISALVGYAIGTFQVLFIDWWRRVTSHRRQLTLLQAELRRLRGFDTQFGWVGDLPPDDEVLPIPPKPSDLLVRTIGEMDWRLTDEHRDDNSQQSFLDLADGCGVLNSYSDKVRELLEVAVTSTGEEKSRAVKRAAGYSRSYDANLDRVLFHIDDALRDIGRRLELTTFGTQVGRALEELPAGINPPGVVANEDPRLQEWRVKNNRRAIQA